MSVDYQEEQDGGLAVAGWVIGGAVTAVLAGVLWFAVWGTGNNFGADSAAAASVAKAAPAAQTAGGGADNYAVVKDGLVKFYFAVGSYTLGGYAPQALASVAEGVRAGKTAVISGFHDASGNAALNAELAKRRALAVRDALLALGVPEDKILLQQPADTEGTGDNREARRVEVSLQ